MSLSSNAQDCIATNGRSTSAKSARVEIDGSVPTSFKSGIEAGLKQWNDCNKNLVDFPWFSTSFGAVTINLSYEADFQSATGKSNCAEYNGAMDGSRGTIALYGRARDSRGIEASCQYGSSGFLSDIFAHELGHYLGLGNSPCDGYIMGPLVNGSSAAKIQNSECSKADALNTNSTEELLEETDPKPEADPSYPTLPYSPIILDLGRDNFRLTGIEDPVYFDIDADGAFEEISWTAAHENDGFLVLDRNGNGLVDDGGELFGNATPLADGSRAPHGFAALAEIDLVALGGNENGTIDPGDSLFSELRIWIDDDHDGFSRVIELFSLDELGILEIELSYVENLRRDRHGNVFRYKGRALVDGPGGSLPVTATDVFFVGPV